MQTTAACKTVNRRLSKKVILKQYVFHNLNNQNARTKKTASLRAMHLPQVFV